MPDLRCCKAIVNKCLEKGLTVITGNVRKSHPVSPLFIEGKILENGLSILEENNKRNTVMRKQYINGAGATQLMARPGISKSATEEIIDKIPFGNTGDCALAICR
jgi:hypothetical protein